MASMSYNLGALVEGRQFLHMREMGPVEGESKVPVESSEEDLEDSEDSEDEDEDMTMKE